MFKTINDLQLGWFWSKHLLDDGSRLVIVQSHRDWLKVIGSTLCSLFAATLLIWVYPYWWHPHSTTLQILCGISFVLFFAFLTTVTGVDAIGRLRGRDQLTITVSQVHVSRRRWFGTTNQSLPLSALRLITFGPGYLTVEKIRKSLENNRCPDMCLRFEGMRNDEYLEFGEINDILTGTSQINDLIETIHHFILTLEPELRETLHKRLYPQESVDCVDVPDTSTSRMLICVGLGVFCLVLALIFGYFVHHCWEISVRLYKLQSSVLGVYMVMGVVTVFLTIFSLVSSLLSFGEFFTWMKDRRQQSRRE